MANNSVPPAVETVNDAAERAYQRRSEQIAADLHATRRDFLELLAMADRAGTDEFDTATVLMERSEEPDRDVTLRQELATMAMLLMRCREEEDRLDRELASATLDQVRTWYATAELCGKDRAALLERLRGWARDPRFPQADAHRLESFVESRRSPRERFDARTRSISESPLASAAEIQAWYDLGQSAGVPVEERLRALREWKAEGNRNIPAQERITQLIDETDGADRGTLQTPGIRRTVREYAPIDGQAAGGLTSGRRAKRKHSA